MKHFYWILCLLFLALFFASFAVARHLPDIVAGYQSNARTPLFSGFITLGSFLLTLKTTILQRLKEGFDSQEHEKAYLFHLENGGKHGYYESLANMSAALSLAVFSALGSAMIQMTFGFISSVWAFALCAAAPASTIIVITYLWWEITMAHKGWIGKIEEDKAVDLKQKNALARPEE